MINVILITELNVLLIEWKLSFPLELLSERRGCAGKVFFRYFHQGMLEKVNLLKFRVRPLTLRCVVVLKYKI